jgi:hypothetical protein
MKQILLLFMWLIFQQGWLAGSQYLGDNMVRISGIFYQKS